MGTESAIRSDESLVVVSNRLPYDLPRADSGRRPKRNVGGLVNALEPVLAARHGVWIGWDGTTQPSDAAAAAAAGSPRTFSTERGVRLVGVPLGEREHQRYYHGCANRTLWPLFHGLIDTTAFRPEDFAAYREVNRRFAETVLSHASRDSHVWVHDYHLMLVPGLLRERGFRGRIDFFLHIPFPPGELFRALPWREDLVRGLLAADSVAFHVDLYRDNFVSLVCGLVGSTAERPGAGGSVTLRHREGGATVAAALAIGIDVDDFEAIAARPDVRAAAERVRASHGGRMLLFGADRLDYTKGIVERLLAVERLIVTRPELAGTFDAVQVVVPSRTQVREYRELKERVDREVGRINGEHGRQGWVPIHYHYRALDRERLVAHYLAADVALVTPLKDGMNLVAQEFVASRIDETGVLVLSEFAGVARYLDQALRVNPHDVEGCARALGDAIAMPRGEQRRRMHGMRAIVRANRVGNWAERCLGLPLAEPAEVVALRSGA